MIFFLHSQFVRDTVQDFYRRFEGGATGQPASLAAVCPTESGQAALLAAQNLQIRSRCGAVPLEAVKEGLEGAR